MAGHWCSVKAVHEPKPAKKKTRTLDKGHRKHAVRMAFPLALLTLAVVPTIQPLAWPQAFTSEFVETTWFGGGNQTQTTRGSILYDWASNGTEVGNAFGSCFVGGV